MCACQSRGTRPAGPGTGWVAGWFSGGASAGPDSYISLVSKLKNQTSPGSKLRMIGWPLRAACALACWDGEESQQPTWPHWAHRRRCTHQPPAASHSTHPGPDGVAAGSMPFVTGPTLLQERAGEALPQWQVRIGAGVARVERVGQPDAPHAREDQVAHQLV